MSLQANFMSTSAHILANSRRESRQMAALALHQGKPRFYVRKKRKKKRKNNVKTGR